MNLNLDIKTMTKKGEYKKRVTSQNENFKFNTFTNKSRSNKKNAVFFLFGPLSFKHISVTPIA